MAQQLINIGHKANDKSGDPIRTAFDKVNQNFTELFATDTNSKYHLGDDVQFVDIDPNSGTVVIQSGFDTSMPVYIKGANCSNGGVGGNVIIEAGGAPLPNDGTTGNVEIAGQQVTIESNNHIWTFSEDGYFTAPGGEGGLSIHENNLISSSTMQLNATQEIRLVMNNSDGTENLRWEFYNNGTLATPTLLPRIFTAILDTSHMITPDPATTLTGDPWQLNVQFGVNPDGTVETYIDQIFPILDNPGYDSGYSFRFDVNDHGIPYYYFTVTLRDVTLPGGAGWTANLECSQPPDYPPTISTDNPISLSVDGKSYVFGPNGYLYLPGGTSHIISDTNSIVVEANGYPGGSNLTLTNLSAQLVSEQEINLISAGGQNHWTFGTDGTLDLPMSVNERAVIQSPYSIEFIAGTHSLILNNSGSLTLDGINIGSSDATKIVNDYGSVQIEGASDSPTRIGFRHGANYYGSIGQTNINDILSGLTIESNGDSPVKIIAGAEWRTWAFDIYGNLRMPANGDIIDNNGNSVLTGDLRFINNAMYNYNGVIVENADLTNFATAALVLPTNTSSNSVELTNLYGNVNVTAGTDNQHVKTWSFGRDGNLTLPEGGDIVDSTNTTVFKTNLSQFTNDLEIDANTLTGTTLAENVTSSSLTSVGTLTSVTSSGVVHITNTEDSINADTGSLQVDGGAHITKNLIAEGTIYAGKDAYSEVLTNPLIVASSPANVSGGYSQVAILNNTAEASGDFQVFVDGYDVNVSDTGWVDLGFAGSNFGDARYTITQPGDGYVFASGKESSTNGGNLVLATDGSGTSNDLIFATGGFTTDKERMRFNHTDNKFYIGNGDYNANLEVTGTSTFNGDIKTTGYIVNNSNGELYIFGDTDGYAHITLPTNRGISRDGRVPRISNERGGVAIQSSSSDGVYGYDWLFDESGDLNLPTTGDIKKGGVSVLSGAYALPTATTTDLGGVKVDGTTIVIDGSGVISSTVVGATILKGTWDASTNTPTLSSSLPAGVTVGWQYLVSVTGTIDIGAGSQTYTAGDIVLYDGVQWVDIPGAAGSVSSFNNRTGAVSLTSGDVTTALGFTPIQNSSLSVSTNSPGTQGLSYTNGVFTFTPALNITGNSATATKLATARNINGVAFDGTGDITVTAAAGTLSGNTLNSGVTGSSLTSVGTLVNLTVTNTISGSVSGSAGSVAASALTGTTLASTVVSSSLTSVGTLANLTVTNTITGSVSGNAGTVTNGVVTTGAYADPSWITSLAYSKLTGAPSPYTLPTSSTSTLGGVKVDGTTITIDGSGVISASGGYSLPTASGSTLGGIKIGTGLSIDGSGVVTTTSSPSLVNGSNTLKLVSAPTTLAGASGDTAGSIAIDNGNIYYCTRNWTSGTYAYTFTTNASSASQNAYLPPPNQATIGTLVYIQGPIPIAPVTGWTLTYNGVTYNCAPNGNPNNGVYSQIYLTTSGVAIPVNSTVTVTAPAGATIWNKASFNTIDKYALSISTGAASGGGSLAYSTTTGIFTFTPAVTSNPTFTAGLAISGSQSANAWGTAGVGFRTVLNTYTDGTSNGTVANNMVHAISAPALAATNATTYTNAATLYIANKPTAGTNVTITNGYSLYVNSGDAYFGGNVFKPNLPSFRVYGTSTSDWSTTNPTGGVMTNAQWTQDYQTGTALGGGTGIFTAPYAGLYSVTLQARCKDNASPNAQCMIQKMAVATSTVSVVCMLEWAANTTVNHIGTASTIKLAVGDTLKFIVSVGTIHFDSNDSYSVTFIG